MSTTPPNESAPESPANGSAETAPEPVEPIARVVTSRVSIRRAPKVPVFLVLGGAIGAIVTIIVTAAFPTDPATGFIATVGYFLLYGIPAGVVLGALVAIILDRVSYRRAKSVPAEQTTVDPLPYPDDDDASPQP
ncbi:hypothetical protein [Lacisediminihabitans changchengi]|uniref:Potassium transporter Trk n=1 Tax=Lacisediminihabitans changchengi TaxID=2787634 RepID=A0A934SNB5_9MICO|nr:hypothetical protein [Lacisediminihabitans changchengi]MBK4348550.1 hypothetical protein [Lacisediminihabitans changchengi]